MKSAVLRRVEGALRGILILFALWLVLPRGLMAQAPAVSSIEPAALSPGALAYVSGSGFGEATVQVGGRQAAVLGSDIDFVSIQIPVELAPGPTTLVVTSKGASSTPFSLTLDPYSPAFHFSDSAQVTFERSIAGGGFGRASCSVGETPKAGELVRVYAAGLGATDPTVPTGMPAPATPVHTVEKPRITVGDQQAETIESVLVPGEIGVYRVTFRLPAGMDEGPYPIVLGIGNKAADPQVLGIGNAVYHATPATEPLGGPTGPASSESILLALSCGALVGNTGQVFQGNARNPSTNLGGITVKVRDSEGVERAAALLNAEPTSVTYVVPAGTANGNARVTITTGEGTVSGGALEIENVTPKMFLNVSPQPGPYPPAGVLVRVHDGAQTAEPLTLPIDLGPETDQVFLVMFGTGWRGRGSLANTGLIFTMGNGNPPSDVTTEHMPADYAGPQNEFAGVDQMNVRLPRSLAGRRILVSGFEVDGKTFFLPYFQAGSFR